MVSGEVASASPGITTHELTISPPHPKLHQGVPDTWPASNVALPPTPSTRKFSKPRRATTAAARVLIKTAKQAVEKAQQYAYRDRKRRKRNFRALWIQRINAAMREHGLTYGRFINGLSNLGIEIDRKVLSDIAINDPAAFKALVDKAAKAASSPVAKAA